MTPAEALTTLNRWAALLGVPEVRQAVDVLHRELDERLRDTRDADTVDRIAASCEHLHRQARAGAVRDAVALLDAADWLRVQASELERLRAAIAEHNAGQIAECEARSQSDGYAGMCAAHKRTSRGRCPDCPMLDMIALDSPEPAR